MTSPSTRAAVCFLPLAAGLLSAAELGAQGPRNFDVVQVADGIYTFLQREPLETPIDGNTTVIINDRDVVVVDTRISPSTAREIIGEIRRLTPLPVRYVINTHWHSDHHYGNDAFREAFPGVEFIGHAATRADMLVMDTDSILRFNIDSAYPQAIARTRALLASGRYSNGDTIPADMHAFYTRQIKGMEFALAEAPTVRIVPPTMTVSDRLRLDRGERVIDIRFLGRANSRGDLVVVLPRERIMLTGDLLVAPIPFSFFSYLGDWIETLTAIDSLPADIIIPGHGPVQRDRRYLHLVRSLLQETLSQVRAAAADGGDLTTVRERVNLDAIRRRFTGDDVLLTRTFRAFFFLPATERALAEVRGEIVDRAPLFP
jgi:cyclase